MVHQDIMEEVFFFEQWQVLYSNQCVLTPAQLWPWSLMCHSTKPLQKWHVLQILWSFSVLASCVVFKSWWSVLLSVAWTPWCLYWCKCHPHFWFTWMQVFEMSHCCLARCHTFVVHFCFGETILPFGNIFLSHLTFVHECSISTWARKSQYIHGGQWQMCSLGDRLSFVYHLVYLLM